MTVSEKLRLVQGLHSHAEMFGFNWNDNSDWTWHDVACKIADEIDDENAKLRELVSGLWYCAHEAYGMCARVPVGGERPFTCCPLYDYDSKVYRCEKLILELRVEVDG